ncbi:MAG: tRNA (N6-threonylcarbamoyladenosine(37)-N6)-methyltransferase TrmO [Peptococcaceae bacterium]|nr:tRNA (N6-threonylcarbamoyladenosine(37)-N6)-methyltransferase TrmO [Peptococcaceae bacterium]
MIFEAIGVVKSPVKEGIDENWGKVISEIHLEPKLASGLLGIDQFSHIIVVFYMDKATFKPQSDLIRRPQGREDMPEAGIFSQRAKHRPNPIGITAVELIRSSGSVLVVKGLDAIDGTPVIDVKPYYPQFDRIENPVVPDWVNQLMKKYF